MHDRRAPGNRSPLNHIITPFMCSFRWLSVACLIVDVVLSYSISDSPSILIPVPSPVLIKDSVPESATNRADNKEVGNRNESKEKEQEARGRRAREDRIQEMSGPLCKKWTKRRGCRVIPWMRMRIRLLHWALRDRTTVRLCPSHCSVQLRLWYRCITNHTRNVLLVTRWWQSRSRSVWSELNRNQL